MDKTLIPIEKVVAQLRREMPFVDPLTVAREITRYLNVLILANSEAMKEFLFSEVPVNPQLATELGLTHRVAKTGKCVATCYDILTFICGFAVQEDGTFEGSLVSLYNPKASSEEMGELRAVVPLVDVPPQLAALEPGLMNFIQSDKNTKIKN